MIGTASYTVAVNPGVVDITAEAHVVGVLHDAPADHAADITKTIGTAVILPDIPQEDLQQQPGLPGLPDTGVLR